MVNKVKYLEVYYTIRNDILAGKYKVGDLLPVEVEFCKILGIGRTTLRRALSMLTEEGLLSPKQGRGTMVISNTPRDAHVNAIHPQVLAPMPKLEGELTYTQSPLVTDSIFASESIAEKLNIPTGSKVFRVQRIRYVNNRSFSYLVSYINPKVAPDLDKHADEIGDHITEYLVKKYGVKRTSSSLMMDIGQVNFKEAQFLGMEINRPTFVMKRVSHVGEDVYDYSEIMYNVDLIEMRFVHVPDPQLDIIEDEDYPGTQSR